MTEIVSFTTILTGAGSGIAVPFINKVLGPTADEIGLMLGERMRLFRLENQFKLFLTAQEMAKAAGIKPKQVNLKTLLPLMDGASLEEDESMANKWAALLANATAPQGDTLVEPSFADVLKQLTPIQARILDAIYQEAGHEQIRLEFGTTPVISTGVMRQELGLGFAAFVRNLENLMRLQLCTTAAWTYGAGKSIEAVVPTVFGSAFIVACTPPKANP